MDRGRWLGMLCLCAMGLFLAHALPAIQHVADADGDTASHHSDCSQNDCESSASCCHGLCQAVFLAVNAPVSVRSTITVSAIVVAEGALPDSPVRDIEHPPQLS